MNVKDFKVGDRVMLDDDGWNYFYSYRHCDTESALPKDYEFIIVVVTRKHNRIAIRPANGDWRGWWGEDEQFFVNNGGVIHCKGQMRLPFEGV